MKLLSPKKTKETVILEVEEQRIASLKVKRKLVEEQRKYSEAVNDWDAEKKKKWEEFCLFNQEIQQKKAVLLAEIEELEKKRDSIFDSIKIHI